MSNPTPPDGWDDIPEEMMVGAREMRKLYLSFVAAGFTAFEAATLIGTMLAANNSIAPVQPNT